MDFVSSRTECEALREPNAGCRIARVLGAWPTQCEDGPPAVADTFWAAWSAPLLVSTDVRKLSKEKRSILLNEEAIAINQDASATSADRIRGSRGGVQLWSRPLANGDQAVVLYNSGRHATNASVAWMELGWPVAESVRVRDVWSKTDLGQFTGGFQLASLAPRDVAFLRLAAQRE
jgi:alpha-galactosidase